MEVSYQQAMETLQSMFEKFDRETIQAVLASNEGHLERTIEDLMKLNEEVENLPDDDDNLFADTDYKPKPRPRYPSGNGQEHYESAGPRSVQESEDAKLAYQLQMQEIKAEQQEKQAAINQYHSESGHVNANQYGGNQQYANQYANQYGHQQGGMQETDPKKASFYKKVKVGLNNLFKRKGKAGKKGPTRNPGIYTQIDGNDGNVPFNAEDDDNDAPMQLADVLGGPSRNNNDDSYSPESPRSPSHHRNDLREYNRNRPSQLNQMDYGGEL